MKNFSAAKNLAYAQPHPYVTSHYYRVHRCVMNTTTMTLKVLTVARPAPHRSYRQTGSFAHLDNAMVIRHIKIKTTHI